MVASIFFSFFLVLTSVLTASTAYCCPPEDPLLTALKAINSEQYAAKYINHCITSQLDTDDLPVAVQVLVNFEISLSETDTLTIMAMDNVWDVYFTLLD